MPKNGRARIPAQVLQCTKVTFITISFISHNALTLESSHISHMYSY